MSSQPPDSIDVLIIGAGAAGLMCAAYAAQRGRTVTILEHANKVGKKILMSGGGRCNFTNLYCEPENFLSRNSSFCKSALSRFTPTHFLEIVHRHKIPFHEKKLGQLFCNNKSKDILEMLLIECQKVGVKIRTKCSVEEIKTQNDHYLITSTFGVIKCQSLVIATGGLSIPKMGATGFGYEVAKQFGINITPTRAGLVPYTLEKNLLETLKHLSGSSIEVTVSCNNTQFNENLLFTHRGLSGPAMLQISSYWTPGDSLNINLLPNVDLFNALKDKQHTQPNAALKTILSTYVTRNIAHTFIDILFSNKGYANKRINQFSDKEIEKISYEFHNWCVTPSGTEGYRTAEVTLGGVNCNEISSKTMEANNQRGLFFIGEVIDVTGQLGGFNFQWAWASGAAAGEHV